MQRDLCSLLAIQKYSVDFWKKKLIRRNISQCHLVLGNLLCSIFTIVAHLTWKVSVFGVFLAVFSRIRTEYGEILCIFPFSFWMRKNIDCFSCSLSLSNTSKCLFNHLSSYMLDSVLGDWDFLQWSLPESKFSASLNSHLNYSSNS